MKKTLMVLSFALCATFAFAQTKNVQTATRAIDDVSAIKAPTQVVQNSGFTGSIFTKDDDIFTCGFQQDGVGYTLGVAAGEMVDGTNIPTHTYVPYHGQWRRIADTTQATRDAVASQGNYPYTFEAGTTYPTRNFASPTADAGLMIMTMQDQISAWGGQGQSGVFDAYVRFDFSTTGCPLVRARIYQYYRKFNRDHCYLDYSNDGGNTWSSVEINVRGVDIATNAAIRGFKTMFMPLSMGNAANAAARIRWCAEEPAGGAYGYIWMFDDFTIIPAPQYDVEYRGNYYFEGFYQLMPQGLNLPVVWALDYSNTGQQVLTGVTGTLYNWMGDATPAQLTSVEVAEVASDPMTTETLLIDPLGWYSNNGFCYSDSVPGVGPTAYLQTSNLGTGHWYGTFSTASGIADTFVSKSYIVNHDPNYHNGRGTWGRDHGIATKFSYYAAGMIDPETFSTEPDNTNWSSAGYGVAVSYNTGNQVPQGWKILGVEMVAATMEGMNQVGAKVNAFLWRDSLDADGKSIWFTSQNTGSNTYTIQQSDVISGEDFTDLTYQPYGTYNTVFIPFPNQPTLRPNSNYRVGYQLPEEGNFAVATSAYYYYTLEDTTGVYFRNDPALQDYAYIQTLDDNAYNTLVRDPFDDDVHFFVTEEFPMIRLVVGPGFYVPKAAVSFECNEDEGYFADGNYNPLCGTTDSIAIGYGDSWYIFPAEGYTIDKVYIDGVETNDYEVYAEEDGTTYGIIALENVQTSHTLSLTCKVGINDVAGVSMKLQPNPATSNVNINLKGVSGNVNMALIDMSGRVITTSQFNAENGTTIDVSNLAKGAYFVRITNDKFSKVEKLIVR